MMKRRLFSVLAGPFIALCSVLAAMSDLDRQNWHKATALYMEHYPKQAVTSHRTTLDSYRHIDNLELKALAHARSSGVIPIANVQHRTYFSSIIKPNNDLHGEMRLDGKDAFAFWKHEGHTFELLHVDTVDSSEVKWPLQPLGEPIRRSA
ncbi:hypothetical protein PHSY_002024 [Pseudozyma hubeiensis SY62]|uniref:Uncharacterized protein n=1 Tax=Pseudozyma hubeiensis (strain SY62) TaxID=1305764 RepID=R9NZW2_PSEHS|nr:hypothetical protein PHSY_002024 [Pseudozyma hubeiensis SY62]GAC94453.1 hypothetical protein PHSY_002024 [Pseudozyma hubeiensis SY62]